MGKSKNQKKLEPLAISCDNSDCQRNLHCFRKSKKMSKYDQGKCQACGRSLVDWVRIHQREIKDIQNTFGSLKLEWIRHHFWHVPIDQKGLNYAKRKGLIKLDVAVEKRIRNSIASANPFRDGWQTPWEGNIIYYAQHATACCCRKCIEYWHNIPMGIELTEEQIKYFKELAMLYIKERVTDLTISGEKIPPIRKGKKI